MKTKIQPYSHDWVMEVTGLKNMKIRNVISCSNE